MANPLPSSLGTYLGVFFEKASVRGHGLRFENEKDGQTCIPALKDSRCPSVPHANRTAPPGIARPGPNPEQHLYSDNLPHGPPPVCLMTASEHIQLKALPRRRLTSKVARPISSCSGVIEAVYARPSLVTLKRRGAFLDSRGSQLFRHSFRDIQDKRLTWAYYRAS